MVFISLFFMFLFLCVYLVYNFNTNK